MTQNIGNGGVLSQGHWLCLNYKQRMTRKEWKQILLNEADYVWFYGERYELVAKNLGCGIVEISKAL